ncbi:MAG: SDR family oxidoreductase [Acidobacteriaceae bacterium]|nr:SDR family oxidoreductase [Acidobacteriaceae bacterium]
MSVLNGRGILVTGGSLGIGQAVALACIKAGAHVAICARNPGDLEAAKSALQDSASKHQRVLAKPVDVSLPAAVSALIEWLREEAFPLTGLVNAAGILGPAGALDEVSIDQWIATIQVNLIGTMLLCRAVLPLFRRQGYGKIVNFSGGGATSPRPRFSAYAASKTAIVRLTENLAKEEEENGVRVNAIAPGAVNTRMLDEVLNAGAAHVGESAYQDALRQQQSGGAPAARAADLCIMLLGPASDAITGRLLSAVWDPWPSLAAHAQDLMTTDIYTLRRIVPTDRGLSWE